MAETSRFVDPLILVVLSVGSTSICPPNFARVRAHVIRMAFVCLRRRCHIWYIRSGGQESPLSVANWTAQTGCGRASRPYR